MPVQSVVISNVVVSKSGSMRLLRVPGWPSHGAVTITAALTHGPPILAFPGPIVLSLTLPGTDTKGGLVDC
jgi:hypothetical protein